MQNLHPAAGQRPTDTYLRHLYSGTFLVWAFFVGEALALLMAMAPGIVEGRMIWFGVNSLMIQWIIFGTLALIRLLHKPLSRLPLVALASTFLALLLGWTAGILTLFRQLVDGTLHLPGESTAQMLGIGCGLAFLFGLMAIGTLQNHLRLQRLALQATRSQLQALQARIRPHFLFNTLNSAVSLARTDPARTESLLMDLSDLFRIALSDTGPIALEEELDLCRRYIAIEEARFGQRLHLDWQIHESLPDIAAPPLCLQPLLENAVHHGVEKIPGNVRIQVSSEHKGHMLHLVVSNPMPPHQSPTTNPRRGHGVGLEAVRARLSAFDPRAQLENHAQDGQYIARLHLPIDQVTTR